MLLLPEFGKAGRPGRLVKSCVITVVEGEREGDRGAVLSLPLPSASSPLAFNAAESKTTVAERHSVLFPEMVHGGQGTVPGGVAVEFSPVLLVARG